MKGRTTETSSQQKYKSQSSNQPIEFIDINTPHHESNPTSKRLRRHLKDAKTKIDRLKKKDLDSKIKLKEMLDLYEETIDKEKFMAKMLLPLHIQLKNVYR